MDKRTFMRELTYHLRELPNEERTAILQDYEDHFKIAEIEGKDEQSLILELGTPRRIAEERLTAYQFTQKDSKQSTPKQLPKKSNHPIHSLLLAFILIIFNVVIVLAPAAAVFGIWLSGWGVALGFSLAPIAWIISFFYRTINIIPEFFVILTITSLGVLLGIGMIYVTKALFVALKAYLKWNVNLIRG
ncbi:hypothetical protein Pryu01_00955 [Paraliobacillus ryukyuensis]|uniref:Putative membrane protein n=1 Tax=Paraliobacillus ryukyuensis TaxID=200904 RepID=A0A366EDS9_9BACI|nr:DUF1700 domain-containing protein [Paraliobacillus ryukyuensis]RBP00473.1 putative membrane protein [Paraliobacillus ryukyuensis]